MKEFDIEDMKAIELSIKEFEILEDVLSEIEEYRVYEDEDNASLNKLKKYFSYKNYCLYRGWKP